MSDLLARNLNVQIPTVPPKAQVRVLREEYALRCCPRQCQARRAEGRLQRRPWDGYAEDRSPLLRLATWAEANRHIDDVEKWGALRAHRGGGADVPHAVGRCTHRHRPWHE